MELKYTRAMITAALNGTLKKADFVHDTRFNVDIPQSCPGVPPQILNPRDTWSSPDAYDTMAKKVAKMFFDNFQEKYPHMPADIINAGPQP